MLINISVSLSGGTLMVIGFGAKFVKEITGVSRMQLLHWDRKGVVRPSIRIGGGEGRPGGGLLQRIEASKGPQKGSGRREPPPRRSEGPSNPGKKFPPGAPFPAPI